MCGGHVTYNQPLLCVLTAYSYNATIMYNDDLLQINQIVSLMMNVW